MKKVLHQKRVQVLKTHEGLSDLDAYRVHVLLLVLDLSGPIVCEWSRHHVWSYIGTEESDVMTLIKLTALSKPFNDIPSPFFALCSSYHLFAPEICL